MFTLLQKNKDDKKVKEKIKEKDFLKKIKIRRNLERTIN
jgi:hypothetical protein